MFQKKYFTILFSISLLLVAGFHVSAQTAPLTGNVELKKKADGTKAPLAGALVEVYRVDIKASLPSSKTNKKGEFSFAGLPLGAIFVLSVSGPGASPSYLPNVKAGMDKLVVTLDEGDGKKLTEAEVRQAISSIKSGSADSKPAELTAEQKKAQAEYEKQKAEVEAKNKETENKNTIIQRSFTEGNEAFNAKNYDLAITKYSEGVAADPNYVGSAPILLNNKGLALKIRGIDAYNKAVKATDATQKADTMARAKKDLEDALDSYNASWTVSKNAAAADIGNQANFEKAKYDALSGLTEIYRLLVVTKTNVAKAANAKEAFDAYLAVETDAAKKAKAQITFGDVMLESGDSEKALAAYRVALETSPDNPDALAGAGLSLVNLGYLTNDKAQFQEGANLLQKFVGIAPENHKYKADAVALIDLLKKEQNVTPQKAAATKKKN